MGKLTESLKTPTDNPHKCTACGRLLMMIIPVYINGQEACKKYCCSKCGHLKRFVIKLADGTTKEIPAIFTIRGNRWDFDLRHYFIPAEIWADNPAAPDSRDIARKIDAARKLVELIKTVPANSHFYADDLEKIQLKPRPVKALQMRLF